MASDGYSDMGCDDKDCLFGCLLAVHEATIFFSLSLSLTHSLSLSDFVYMYTYKLNKNIKELQLKPGSILVIYLGTRRSSLLRSLVRCLGINTSCMHILHVHLHVNMHLCVCV